MGLLKEALKKGKNVVKKVKEDIKDKKSKAYLKKREKEHIETKTDSSGLKTYRTPEESKKIAANIAKNKKTTSTAERIKSDALPPHYGAPYPNKNMPLKEKIKRLKQMDERGYKTGGPVKKSIDGIATKGFTRAKHR